MTDHDHSCCGHSHGHDHRHDAAPEGHAELGAAETPVLVEVTRGGMVESRHRGIAAIVDADGHVVAHSDCRARAAAVCRVRGLGRHGVGQEGVPRLAAAEVSESGRLLAYATSDAGSDWRTWAVRDVESGDDLPDRLTWSKFASAAWTRRCSAWSST